MAEFTNTNVIDNYNQIIDELDFVSKLLRKRLEYHNVPDLENKSFDELVDKIEDIQAVTHINKNNEEPLIKPELNFTNISTFNESLFKLIRFYMKKVAYFLVLKGVPPYVVRKAKTLRQLIDLILFVETISSTHLFAEGPNIAYYGNSVLLLTKVIDEYGFSVLRGYIVVKDKETGATLTTTQAGQNVYFTPPRASEKINNTYKPQTFIIEYHGTEKYLPAESVEVDIIIYPTKIDLQVDIENISPESRYYHGTTTGHHTDTWKISIKTLNYDNTPLKNIPFTMKIGNQTIQASTNSSGKYEVNRVINQTGEQEINIETTYANTDELTNSEYQQTVNIKYNILQQVQSTYTDYAGKTYTLEASLHNEIDNTISNIYDNNDVIIFINGTEYKTIHAQNGLLTLNINKLLHGEHTITWVFYEDDFHTSMKTKVNIISNFTWDNECNLYYLNDLPQITYKPLGQTSINKKVQAKLKRQYNDIESQQTFELYTNKNGLLHALSEYNEVGIYELELTTKTDNLSETCIFNYEIKKPFILTRYSYNKKESVEYRITILNTEDETSIFAINNSKPIAPSSIQTPPSDDKQFKYYTYTANLSSYGTNVLTVSNNGYTETATFDFIEKIFTLLTNEVTYGFDSIQIETSKTVDSIIVESDYIDDIEIGKEIKNGKTIFTISGVFKTTGPISFSVIDDENSSETFNVQVNKAEIDTTISMLLKRDNNNIIYSADEIPYDDIDENSFLFRINNILYYDDENTETNIKIAYSVHPKGSSGSIEELLYFNPKEQGVIFTKKLSEFTLQPRQYVIQFYFEGNYGYNGFTKEINFTILKKNPNISFDIVDAYMPIYRRDIDTDIVPNTFTINNIDNVEFKFYVNSNQKYFENDNNTIQFILTEIGNVQLKLVTIEDSIFNSITITKNITGYDYPNEINNIINKLIEGSNYEDTYGILNGINCIVNNMLQEIDNCDDGKKQRTYNIIDRMRDI